MKKVIALLLAVLFLIVFPILGCKEEKKEETKKSITTTSPLPDSIKVTTSSDSSFIYDIYPEYIEITAYIGSGAVVNIPAQIEGVDVLSIGKAAFYGNTTVTTVILPDTVVNIANKAFGKCSSLSSINMPNVRALGMEAFKGTALTEITIPPVLQNLGKYAFAETQIEKIILPASIVRAGDYTFAGCPNLTEVIFPANMTEINTRMFYNCSSLTEVIIPQQITEIGEYAYSSCQNLTKLYIPKTVTKIGEGIVYNSPNAVLIVEKGSAAHDYAKNNNIPYEIGEIPVVDPTAF